jgi:hypothetical protein
VLRGAADPQIVDIADGYGVFYAQLRKRRKFYAEAGFDVVGAAGAEPELQPQGFAFLSDDDE